MRGVRLTSATARRSAFPALSGVTSCSMSDVGAMMVVGECMVWCW